MKINQSTAYVKSSFQNTILEGEQSTAYMKISFQNTILEGEHFDKLDKLDNLTNLFKILPVLFCLLFQDVYPEINGYMSYGKGHDSNPLGNYKMEGDRIGEGYLELEYNNDNDTNFFSLKYTGGLSLFNNLQFRNYYEHSITGLYKVKYPKKVQSQILIKSIDKPQSKDSVITALEPLDSSDSDSTDVVENDADSTNIPEIHSKENDTLSDKDSTEVNVAEMPDDSTSTYLDYGFIASARHDYTTFSEYNNYGGNGIISYRTMPADFYHIRITNTMGYRDYPNLNPLSNFCDLLDFKIGNKFDSTFNYGIDLSAGAKVYTVKVYDTTKFEPTRSFIVKSPGHGKPGAKIYSTKIISIEPASNTQFQFGANIFLQNKTGIFEFLPSVGYIYNPQNVVRYLAHISNVTLNEDLYNDTFSYEGFQSALRIKVKLPFEIQEITDLQFVQRKFGAPALDTNGVQIGSQRKDLRSLAGIYITRFFKIYNNIGVDIALGAEYLRNQSNDNYNDYYMFKYVFSLGVGF